MPIKAKLTKAEYDALDNEQKQSYELIGESAFFTGEIPDVASMDTALKNERALHQQATERLKAYAGIDPVKYREALEAQRKPTKEHDLTTIEGLRAALAETQENVASMRTEFTNTLKTKDDQSNQLRTDATIREVLEKAGVIPEAMADAMDAVRKMVKPRNGDPTVLGVIGPGDTFIDTPFDQWATGDLKKQKGWFFADSGNGGTGSRANNRSVRIPPGVDLSKLSATERLKYANEHEAETAT